MVAYPNENQIVYGIVVGGNDSDPDPTCSGGSRIYIPGQYGKDVDIKHLPFSRNLAQGTQNGITNFNPPAEHGSAVMCMKMGGHAGTGHLTILGTVPNDTNKGSTTPGNSIGLWPAIDKALKDTTKIRIPPSAGKGPADSKPPKEKGKYHSHDIVKGIPSSATLWPINGMKIPQVQNISSAIQAFSNVLTGDLLGMLPGMNMSMGSLFDMMPSALKDQLMKAVPPDIAAAMNTMSNLMQSMESNESGGFSTATKINPDVFFQNAVNVLADARTVYDMVNAFQRLQHDTSLYGLDSLPPVNFTMTGGPFGDIPMAIDALGNISSNVPGAVQTLMDGFTSLMSNGSGFPGVFPGANMFGGSSQVLNDMFKRLPTGEMSKAITQMQKNVAPGGDPRKAVNNIHKFAATGVKMGLKALKSAL